MKRVRGKHKPDWRMPWLVIPYGLLMFGFLIAGWLTGERLCFLIFVTQLLLLLFCAAIILYTIRSFSFLQTISRQEAVKGETVILNLEIHNEMPYPFTMMKVHIQSVSPRDDRVLSFHLAPMDSIRFELPLYCQWTGEVGVGMGIVELEDMFGLVHINFPMKILPYYRPRTLLVLPKADPLTLSAKSQARRLQVSGSLTQRSDSGYDIYDLRGYQPGDTDRQIHWKASAAHHALYTRRYEREARPQCILVMDDTMKADGEEARMTADLLCCAAATLAQWALSHQSGVRLCAGSPSIPPVEGTMQQDFPVLQRWLALLPFEGNGQTPVRLDSELAGRSGEGKPPVYLLTADAVPLFDAMAGAQRKGAEVVCIRTVREIGIQLPPLPDGILDIVLEPGCDIGARLGEML